MILGPILGPYKHDWSYTFCSIYFVKCPYKKSVQPNTGNDLYEISNFDLDFGLCGTRDGLLGPKNHLYIVFVTLYCYVCTDSISVYFDRIHLFCS